MVIIYDKFDLVRQISGLMHADVVPVSQLDHILWAHDKNLYTTLGFSAFNTW